MNLEQIMQEAQSYFPTDRKHLVPSVSEVLAFTKHCVEKSQQWRPIDDNAKSGKPVFVLEKGIPLKACWIAKHTEEVGASDFHGEDDYNEANETSYWPEGWYEWNQHEETHWALDSEPTHYMTIPPAPEAA